MTRHLNLRAVEDFRAADAAGGGVVAEAWGRASTGSAAGRSARGGACPRIQPGEQIIASVLSEQNGITTLHMTRADLEAS